VSETTAAISAPKRNSKKLLITGGGAVIVLALAGGGAFWWSQQAQAQTATPEVEHHADKDDGEERGIVTFEPFVVNLADASASRFLRVKVQVVVANAEEAESFEKSNVKLSRARAGILELLTTQTSDVRVTTDGMKELRKAISEGLHKTLDVEIIDVLFSDFVVQF